MLVVTAKIIGSLNAKQDPFLPDVGALSHRRAQLSRPAFGVGVGAQAEAAQPPRPDTEHRPTSGSAPQAALLTASVGNCWKYPDGRFFVCTTGFAS